MSSFLFSKEFMMRYSNQTYPHHIAAGKLALQAYCEFGKLQTNGSELGPFSPWMAYMIDQLVRFLENGKGTRRQRMSAAKNLVLRLQAIGSGVMLDDPVVERTNPCESWTRYRDHALIALPLGTWKMTTKLRHYHKILQRLEREVERGNVDKSRNVIFRYIAHDVNVKIQTLLKKD